MSDLISRQALKLDFIAKFCGFGVELSCDQQQAIALLIDEQPSIEAEPVKHGRWITTIYTTTSKRNRIISNNKFNCSECGCGNGRKQSNYCPNCGAKMDLEVDHENNL